MLMGGRLSETVLPAICLVMHWHSDVGLLIVLLEWIAGVQPFRLLLYLPTFRRYLVINKYYGRLRYFPNLHTKVASLRGFATVIWPMTMPYGWYLIGMVRDSGFLSWQFLSTYAPVFMYVIVRSFLLEKPASTSVGEGYTRGFTSRVVWRCSIFKPIVGDKN